MNYYDFISTRRVSVALDEDERKPANGESLAEHREHCNAKPGNCPFEKRAKKLIEEEDRIDRHGGRYRGKQDEAEGVRSYVTRAENRGTASKPKWREVKTDAKGRSLKDDHSEWMSKGKHDKWYALKDPKEISDTPNFDSFSDVEARPHMVMSAFDESDLYKRSDSPSGEGSSPKYRWTRGGEQIPDEEATRLEAALKEKGYTSAINPDYTGVAVRPDLYTGNGQVTRFTNKAGEVHNDYTDRHKEEAAIEKYKHVNALLAVYPKIKDRIFDDCDQGKEEAILAYFLMRTKIRAGSKKDPTGGRGATDLEKGDFTLSDDGETFYVSFNGKSRQWWHVTCKDKFLYDYIKSRKGEISGPGANDESIFKADYKSLIGYLHDISSDLVDSDADAFDPHDFRRVGATRIAMTYMEKELGDGLDPVKDRKKWEDRVVKAVIAAAKHLNDKPETVFKSYVAPNLLFASSKDEMVRQFPFLKGVMDE